MSLNVQIWAPGFVGFGGGIHAFSRELAEAIQANGDSVHLVGKSDRDGKWNDMHLIGGGNHTGLFAAKGLWAGLITQQDRLISSHLNFGPIVRWAGRLARCKYSLVAHGIDVNSDLSHARLLALRDADQLIAVSQWTRQRLLDLDGIDDENVVVLPNTYDSQRFCVGARSEQLKERYGIQEHEKVILTVARLDSREAYKGYDRVMQALPAIGAACGQVRFLIAGKGEDRTRLETMAKQLGVGDAVTFTGFVPDEELANHYRLADAFAMPSTGEGFGIVFLEAMACGTPVLGGNRDGSVDALNGGKLGLLVDPRSVEEIAEGLIALLKKQGPEMWFDRNALSAAVREKYGREAFQQRVTEIFLPLQRTSTETT